MTVAPGQKIRLKRLFKGVASGSVGQIIKPCGCRSNPGWVVDFGGNEVIVHQRNTKGYEHYEFVEEAL